MPIPARTFRISLDTYSEGYSPDIGINTAPTCDGPICFMPELVAGSAAKSVTQPQPQIYLQPTACNVSALSQPLL